MGRGFRLVSHESTGGFSDESGGGRRRCEDHVARSTGVDPEDVEGARGIVEHVWSSTVSGLFTDGSSGVFSWVEE